MISREMVQKIAGLARLELTDSEIEKMQKDLAEILGYVDALNEVDVTNIKPTSHSLPVFNVMRADVAEEIGQGELDNLLNQAPETENNYYKVKEILTN
ncbi:MAG: Asp-tRNA(Asn)/Glu-tRNA(Gln) amidotransferase subunit GatC [Candidatus Gribaldobacteria bacterium]|nr:Asp-tRNA(Asn)/Glu-tRNA(Gln) amidotransferase subunit GatC [Candidatus Gribaldobacteria bacterium]